MQNKSKSCMIHIEDQENAPITHTQQKNKQKKIWRMKGDLRHGWEIIIMDYSTVILWMTNERLHTMQPIDHVIHKKG